MSLAARRIISQVVHQLRESRYLQRYSFRIAKSGNKHGTNKYQTYQARPTTTDMVAVRG